MARRSAEIHTVTKKMTLNHTALSVIVFIATALLLLVL